MMYYSYDSKWGICSCLILSILSLHINMTNDMSPIGEFEGNMTAASLIFTILKGQLASAKTLTSPLLDVAFPISWRA